MAWRYNVAALGAAPAPVAPRRTATSAPAATMSVTPRALVVRTHPASHAFVASEGRYEHGGHRSTAHRDVPRNRFAGCVRSSIGGDRDVTRRGPPPRHATHRAAPQVA